MVEFSIKPAENGYIAHETREQTKTFVFDTLDEVMQEMLTAFEGRYAGLSGDSYGRVTIERGQEEKNELAVAKEEIAQLKRNGAFHVDVCTAHLRHIKELQKELEEQTEQENRHILMSNNVEQTLGKILGYPWYKDDKKNFPDATEEDGVCVGEDTIETLADRAAERIRHLEEEISALREKLRNQTLRIAELVGENEALKGNP